MKKLTKKQIESRYDQAFHRPGDMNKKLYKTGEGRSGQVGKQSENIVVAPLESK